MKNKPTYKTRKITLLAFEGKENKTESIYFSHFEATNNSRIVTYSTGVTDPQGMVNKTKHKQKELVYNARYDKTYIFIDADNNPERLKAIQSIIDKKNNNFEIIVSDPCFELWFLNHFVKTTKELTYSSLENELKKYLLDYKKNRDYFELLLPNLNNAITNSEYQFTQLKENPTTNVVRLFLNHVIKEKQ